MSDYSYDYSVLVVAETDFSSSASNPEEYMKKLKSFLESRAGDSNLRIVTVDGRYGIPFETVIGIDDKNKTAFVKSLDEHLNQFNEVVMITNFEKEPFLDALGTRLGELSKSFTIYAYKTQSHEKS